MKIVKLTPSKRVKDRYYADLEDGSKLKVNVNLIADHGLFTGRDLDDEELSALRGDADRSELRARALRITGMRAMSRKELTNRLGEKGAEDQAAEETADWLEKLGVLDDEEYSKMIARHYTAKGYGKGRVRDELYRRGVPRELWDGAMAEIEEDGSAIDRIVESKLKCVSPDDGAEAYSKAVKKLTAALLRRGFSWDEIRAALERYKINSEE